MLLWGKLEDISISLFLEIEIGTRLQLMISLER